jgi:hypothetical protein
MPSYGICFSVRTLFVGEGENHSIDSTYAERAGLAEIKIAIIYILVGGLWIAFSGFDAKVCSSERAS